MSKSEDKEVNRLDELYRKLKEVDKQVEERYNEYAPDQEITELKSLRVCYIDEINRIENKK